MLGSLLLLLCHHLLLVLLPLLSILLLLLGGELRLLLWLAGSLGLLRLDLRMRLSLCWRLRVELRLSSLMLCLVQRRYLRHTVLKGIDGGDGLLAILGLQLLSGTLPGRHTARSDGPREACMLAWKPIVHSAGLLLNHGLIHGETGLGLDLRTIAVVVLLRGGAAWEGQVLLCILGRIDLSLGIAGGRSRLLGGGLSCGRLRSRLRFGVPGKLSDIQLCELALPSLLR